METAHSFRSIRARTVYLIPLYSTGGPLRAVVLLRGSGRQILPRIVEVSLFKMEHSQTQKRPTEKENPDGPPPGLVLDTIRALTIRARRIIGSGRGLFRDAPAANRIMPHLYSSMTSPPCKLRFLLARHRSGRRTASTLRLVEELGGESDN
jgi:hypothetical protein